MKAFYQVIERWMSMSDAVWRRHASPWSCWTRMFLGLPLICLAIWSRDWIGWWALSALVLVAIWIWLNPRVFPEPDHFDRWVSRAVVGEYVFLRHRDEVAHHHVKAADTLAWLSLPGVLLLAAGLWSFDLIWTIAGAALTVLPKMWFLDRMVWLYDDFLRSGGSVLGIQHKEIGV